MDRRVTSFLIGSLLLPLAAGAAEFTVNSNASNGNDATAGDGICETTAGGGVCTLIAAIQEANALAGTDTINLPSGLYGGTTSITDGVALIGAGSSITIIDDAGFGVFGDQPVTISGLTVRDGGGISADRGIWLDTDGDLLLSDVVIEANAGSGILTSASGINQLTIENSVIEGNNLDAGTFSFGGGLYLQGPGNVTIVDSTIHDNSAGFGGGIYNRGATLKLSRSTVSNNRSTGDAKGFDGGGGIVVTQSASLTVVNSTISGNEAAMSGGGIVIDDGSVALYSSTITDNQADSDTDSVGSGGGIFASTDTLATNVMELRNTIVADNAAATEEAADCTTANLTVNSFGYNLVGTGTDTVCAFVAAAGDQLGTSTEDIDAKLAPLATLGHPTATHGLTVGSPALDGGNPGGCEDAAAGTLTVDQRGLTRELDGGSGAPRCDIGAVETFLLVIPNAGPDQQVQFGETVILDGSSSSAFYGILSYNWSEVPTPSVTLDDASVSTPSFVAPSVAGDLVFELTVIDNSVEMATDSVTVSVIPPPAIGVIEKVLKAIKKYKKKSAIKKHKKSKKALNKAAKHLASAIDFYSTGDLVNGQLEVDKAIADLTKAKKLKSKIRKLIKKLKAI